MLKGKADKLIISLDIGSDSLKVVKGTKKEGKICVLDFAYRAYPAEANTPDLLSKCIHDLLASVVDIRKIKKFRVHSTISGRKCCIRVVKLPVMPRNEIEQAIRSKIRKYVSPDLDKLIFRFFVLGETHEEDIKKLEVLFVAIQKNHFEENHNLFKLSGIEPQVITSPCFSGWNLIRELGLNKGVDSSLILVNIDSQETDLTVYRDDRFVFTRNISVGWKDFTDVLKDQSRLSLYKTEDSKLLWGEAGESPPSGIQDEASILKIRKLLQNQAEILYKEIELTAYHYYQVMHGKRIDKCIILGEGSQIQGLVDFLRQKSDIPLECLTIPDAKLELPTDKKGEEFKKNLPLYMQALGVLLNGPNDVNLAVQMKRRAKGDVYSGILANFSQMNSVPVRVVVSLLLISFMALKGINLYYKQQIKSYQARRNNLEDKTLQLAALRRKADILDLEKKFYLQLIKSRPAYPVIIAEISKVIPQGKIVLNELTFSSDQQKSPSLDEVLPIKFTMVGRAAGKDERGLEIPKFVRALEQSGYFENISVNIKGADVSTGGIFDANQQAPEGVSREWDFVINGVVRIKE